METIVIQITHAGARRILKELEKLRLIRVIEENHSAAKSLSSRLAGKLSAETAEKLQHHIQATRSEWERNT